MVAKQMGSASENAQESPLILKSITAVGVAVLSSFLFVNWQHTLSEAKLAKEAEKTVAAQTASIPTASTTPAQTEPVAANSAATVSQTPTAKPAENPSVSAVVETTLVNENSATTVESEAEITDPNLIASLNQKLYNEVDQAWQQIPTFSDNLVYQVKVQENGEIADYAPLNEAAANYLSEVPIDELHSKTASSLSEKVANFLVVLTPGGGLQVNPWLGKN